MRTGTKVWLILAIALILLGVVLFGGLMMKLDWDFKKLSTSTLETNAYDITQPYQNIRILSDVADLEITPSEREETEILCVEEGRGKHSVFVENGTLVIRQENQKKWYDYIGIHFAKPKLYLTIPKGAYGDLTVALGTGNVVIPVDYSFDTIDISCSTGNITNYSSASGGITIRTSTGNITVVDVTCQGDVNLTVSTGKVKLQNLTCKNLQSAGDTGNITMENVIAEDSCSITRSTGNVKLTACDGQTVSITTSTGYVKGSLLSEKVFITKTDTGKISVPQTASGGKCHITTDTGDVEITLK